MITPYYDDGTVSIYLGDCRTILPVIETNASTVITDPPYGETSLVWDRWPDGWIDALPADARQLWTFGSLRMLLDHVADFAGWRFAQDVVWEKHNGSGFAADRFKRVHETPTHWYRGDWASLTINPVMVPGATARSVHRKSRPAHTGDIDRSHYETERGGPKLERSVIFVRSCHGRAIHPTEKPIGIVEPLVRYSTNRGDTILDPFSGSGAILDAARQNGRRAIGIEADERYAEAAARRLDHGVFEL